MTRPLRVPLDGIARGELLLPTDSARYVTRVHRLGVGDSLTVFDPSASIEADARVVDVDRDRCRIAIDEPRPAANPAQLRVTLAQGLGKGDKIDAVVRDATELGATRIVPLVTARTVRRPEGDGPRARLHRIAVEAARQSGRGDIPLVEGPLAIATWLSGFVSEGTLALCLDPSAETTMASALRRLKDDAAVCLLIGPEGGFDTAELDLATQAGFVRVSLGRLVLRTETAATAAMGAIVALSDER